jgi:pSer/pThr/pTyr-binding forkhead associated (FHA) protein
MPARLVPLNQTAATAILIRRPVLLVGRHAECDIRLDRPQVSRRHCCLAQAYERLLIRDLGSHNGLRVNGQKVEEAQLEPGDEVAIAHLIFRYEPDPDMVPARPAAAPPPAAAEDELEDLIPLDPEDL